MGALTRGEPDTLTISTTSRTWTPKGAVTKTSTVSILLTAAIDIVLGLRVLAAQDVEMLKLAGADVTNYQTDPQSPDIVRALNKLGHHPGEKWLGFNIPSTHVPQSSPFDTEFTITKPPPKPGFQLVPVVMAHSIRELDAGIYWIGTSIVLAANVRAREVPSR